MKRTVVIYGSKLTVMKVWVIWRLKTDRDISYDAYTALQGGSIAT